MKLMARPKGSTPKEEKIVVLIDHCMMEENDDLLNCTLKAMQHQNMEEQYVDILKLIARPPPSKYRNPGVEK